MSLRAKLRGLSFGEAVRLVWRKAVHRNVLMGVWGMTVGDATAPSTPCDLRFELWGPDRYDEILDTNPHLDATDLRHFHEQETLCIVGLDGDRIAASSWMTRGSVWVHELQRTLEVPPGEHFSCRSYVDDDYRGQAIFAWMIVFYSRNVESSDRVWGLVYPWNEASVRSLENVGWRRTGDEWSRYVLGRQVPGRRSYPTRPPMPRRPRPTPGQVGPTAIPPCVLLAETAWGGTLHAARSLAASGVPVYVATAGRGASIYRSSRSITDATDVVADGGTAFVGAVTDWVDRIAPDALGPIPIIPLSDRTAELLHLGRDALPQRFRPVLAPAEALPPLLNKPGSLRIAEASGLDVPRWAVVTRVDDVAAAHELTLPVIIRPTSWSTSGERYFKLEVAATPAALDEALGTALARGAELLVQEYLTAADRSVEFAIGWRSEDGTATEICTGRKHRESSAEGGVMAWGTTEDLPDVRAGLRSFFDASGYRGLGGIEFIRTGGRSWFIEFNPRVESIHFLAAKAGVDTVVAAYQDVALGQRSTIEPPQERAAAWIGSAWFTRLIAHPGQLGLALRDRAAFQRFPLRVRAIWDPTDPRPGLAVARAVVRSGLGRRGRPT